MLSLDLRNSPKFSKIRTANYNGSFPSRIPTTTLPNGTGVLTLGDGTAAKPAGTILLIPYGTGAATTTLKMRVIGWRIVTALYVPVLLAEFTCTHCTAVGIAGSDVLDTENFCDTITLTTGTGTSAEDVVLTSPVNNAIAHCIVATKGFSLIEVIFDKNASSTDCNALWAGLT